MTALGSPVLTRGIGPVAGVLIGAALASSQPAARRAHGVPAVVAQIALFAGAVLVLPLFLPRALPPEPRASGEAPSAWGGTDFYIEAEACQERSPGFEVRAENYAGAHRVLSLPAGTGTGAR